MTKQKGALEPYSSGSYLRCWVVTPTYGHVFFRMWAAVVGAVLKRRLPAVCRPGLQTWGVKFLSLPRMSIQAIPSLYVIFLYER